MADLADDAFIEELRRGLEGVTPGPWWLSDETERDLLKSRLLHGMPEGMLAIIRAEHQGRYYGDANAVHIARCSPDRILALLDRLEAAERDRDMWKGRDAGWREAFDEMLVALQAADHTLSVHGKIDGYTDLHTRIDAAISKAQAAGGKVNG